MLRSFQRFLRAGETYLVSFELRIRQQGHDHHGNPHFAPRAGSGPCHFLRCSQIRHLTEREPGLFAMWKISVVMLVTAVLATLLIYEPYEVSSKNAPPPINASIEPDSGLGEAETVAAAPQPPQTIRPEDVALAGHDTAHRPPQKAKAPIVKEKGRIRGPALRLSRKPPGTVRSGLGVFLLPI
jgi:hypothetical protein